LRTGYSRAIHRNKMEGTPDPYCRNTYYGNAKKHRKKEVGVLSRKKYGKKEKKEQKCW
jgi:hypothetical protein